MPAPVWVVSDGAAGHRRQAEALARALDLPWQGFALTPRAPWSWFAPRLLAGATRALPAPLVEAARAAPPLLAIGCGRQAALATAWLRARAGVFAVQILDPRHDLSRWDLIVAPAHDGLSGANVITTLGALTEVTPARLAAAAREAPLPPGLPAPRTLLLVGASHRAQRIDGAYLDALVARLATLVGREGGSVLASTSRRTPAALAARLAAGLAPLPHRLWTGPADGPNPYWSFLGHADRIVVTPDSANMLSEACASGRPVYTFAPNPPRGKLARLHRALRDSGRLRVLGASFEDWRYEPLAEAAAVAATVRARAAAAGLRLTPGAR